MFVSAKVADIVDEKEQYTKNKALNVEYYTDLILTYLEQFGNATKSDIVKLLGDKLSNTLDEKQRENRVRYLLTLLREKGVIERSSANRRTGTWRLAKTESE